MNKEQLMTKIFELIDEYCENRINSTVDEEVESVDVHMDEDGHYVDNDGFVWDLESESKIGRKDPVTKKIIPLSAEEK